MRRFPFFKHKTERWSLEHIHALQSEGLSKKEQWVSWLTLHMESLERLNDASNQTLIDEVAAAIDGKALGEDVFKALFGKVTRVLSEDGSMDYAHSLSNMALLEQSDNSSLSNSSFDVKRNKVLDMDKKGDYIPECSRRVFLKYYTPSEENQMYFWSKADRNAYIKSMDTVLRAYLSKIGREIKSDGY